MLQIHNTLSGKLEEFRPMIEGEVRFYYCGPTVWDYGHIGNFRSAIAADLIRRYLKFKGSFGVPKLIAQMQVEYTDGTSDTIVTDHSWQAADSPVGCDCRSSDWPTTATSVRSRDASA